MKNFVVTKSVNIKANSSEVWDALTNPEKTKKYFFKCKVFSDWKVGSPITFKGKMFWIIKFELNGTILEIIPEKILKYNLHNNSNKSTTSTVTDELTFENGITTLSITDDVGKGKDAEKRYGKSMKGWDKVLKGLKELVEERK